MSEDEERDIHDFQADMARTVRTLGLMMGVVLPASFTVQIYVNAGWVWWLGTLAAIYTLGWFTMGRVLWGLSDIAIEDREAAAALRRAKVRTAQEQEQAESVDVVAMARAGQDRREREQERLERIAELQELRGELNDERPQEAAEARRDGAGGDVHGV